MNCKCWIVILCIFFSGVNLLAQKANSPTLVNFKIIDASTAKVTPAMICLMDLKDSSIHTPSLKSVVGSLSKISDFYKGIEFNSLKNWTGPIRKMNGIGTNNDRSFVYGSLPSLPYWKAPVIYQVSGDFDVELMPGKYRISIEHGNEYIPIGEDFVITGKEATTQKSFVLKRWINLPQLGWYSGDVHVHHPTTKKEHKDFLLEYATAEDVHMANVLEMGHHSDANTDFKQEGFGEKFRICRGNICLASGQEGPRSDFGHIIGLNINQFIREPDPGYNYYDLVFKKLHQQPGAIVGFAHFSWNGCSLPRGFPWYVTSGEIDFVELLQFSKINTLDYYDYLDLGFRLTAAAGSDIPWGSTMGEVRTFVYTGKKFSANKWFEGLKAGNTFVSNGPAIFLNADGKLPGSEIIQRKESSTVLSVKGISNAAIGVISKIAIYNSDGLVAEKINIGKKDSLVLKLNHTLTHSQWLAAAVFCENSAVAHTTPIYFIVDNQPTWNDKKAPAIILKQEEAINKTEQEEKALPHPDQGILSRLANAKVFYKNLREHIQETVIKDK